MSLIDLLRFRPAFRSLRGIEMQLKRLADLYEMELVSREILRPKDEGAPAAPEVLYTDEEQDYFEELQEALRVARGHDKKPVED